MIIQFPKIDSLRNYKKSCAYHGNPLGFDKLAAYPKLDGSNCSIALSSLNELVTQSRNRIITPDADNFGFAAWAEKWRSELVNTLRFLGVRAMFGEWIGKGIQKSPLPERYWCVWGVWDGAQFISADIWYDLACVRYVLAQQEEEEDLHQNPVLEVTNMKIVRYLPDVSYLEDEEAIAEATQREIEECSFHKEHFGTSIPGEGLVWWRGDGPAFKTKEIEVINICEGMGALVDSILTDSYVAQAKSLTSDCTSFVRWLLEDATQEHRFDLAGVDIERFKKALARAAAALYQAV